MNSEEPEFRKFLSEHQAELINIGVWAAFGFKNYAERDAVALLKKYNERQKNDQQMILGENL